MSSSVWGTNSWTHFKCLEAGRASYMRSIKRVFRLLEGTRLLCTFLPRESEPFWRRTRLSV